MKPHISFNSVILVNALLEFQQSVENNYYPSDSESLSVRWRTDPYTRTKNVLINLFRQKNNKMVIYRNIPYDDLLPAGRSLPLIYGELPIASADRHYIERKDEYLCRKSVL